ncbi:unknown [Clostridium sp. CAG:273]|nr:unknown [Clostridium sp. CAG:273]
MEYERFIHVLDNEEREHKKCLQNTIIRYIINMHYIKKKGNYIWNLYMKEKLIIMKQIEWE